jgi:rubrerythrin
MIQFNADEVFEMAERLERNGARFYRHAAELAQVSEHQHLLMSLAAMEDAHEMTFKELRTRLVTPELRKLTVFDPEEQQQQYLWAWADREVFPVDEDPFAVLGGAETIEVILNAAIGREKDAIVFFEGVKHALRGEMDRERIDAIIMEELDHIALLSKERAALK